MNANIGTIDRTLRVVVGLAILSIWFIAEGPARWFALIGLIPLATSLFSFCPLYTALGISTRK